MAAWMLPPRLAAALVIALAPAASARAATPSTVVTVYWSSENFPGTQALDSVIQDVLRSGPERVDYFSEYLESDRFPDEQASAALHDYIRQKFRDRHVDVVIAITDVALQFVLRYRAEMFPDAAVVFAGVAAPDATVRATGRGVTGVLYGPGYGDTLRLALTFHPSTTRVYYVAEASDPALRGLMRAQLYAVAHGVELIDVNPTSMPGLIAAVKAVPPGSLILFIRYSQDEAGNVLFPSQIAPVVAHAADVPVYGVAETYVGSGIVGGLMSSRDLFGTRIGQMARTILQGTRAQDIPIEHTPLVPMFDWRQLQRWRIPESALPPHSVVLFREVSVWQRYRNAIVVTAAVVVLQSFLIAGLIVERRRRRRAEIESRSNFTMLAHLDRRAAMGELATSLAHELNQPLNAILQNAGVAQMLLASTPEPSALDEVREIIGDIRKDDVRASEVIRRMRGLLQKHELESQPVDLNEIARETLDVVRPDAQSRGVALDPALLDTMQPIVGDRVHLQQVLLNLLMNALDAAASAPPERRRVRVSTTQYSGEVRLAVADKGPGIPADQLAKIFEPFYTTKLEGTGMGMGLAIARSIVEAHSGRMGAENNPGAGATIWFSLPTA